MKIIVKIKRQTWKCSEISTFLTNHLQLSDIKMRTEKHTGRTNVRSFRDNLNVVTKIKMNEDDANIS